MQGIGNELADIVESERRQHDLSDSCSGFADGLQHPHKLVGGSDFVVAVGADQEQVRHFRMGEQVLEEVERCCIEPLQIVEEQCQGMVRAGEYVDKTPEYQLKSILSVLRRQI